MNQDEELHAELLAKFREYFEENQRWLSEGTKASARRLRKRLSEIRKICSERRVVVREWMKEREDELEVKEAIRQAQKRQAGKDQDAN
jgi:uncharacterized protein YggL (DUF469 family)